MDFDMGKYGLFVWGAYGISFIGIIGLVALSLKTHAQKARALKALNETIKAKQTPKPAKDEAPTPKELPTKERSA